MRFVSVGIGNWWHLRANNSQAGLSNYLRLFAPALVQSDSTMKTQSRDNDSSTLATRVAPEDLRRGDFVGILSETVELPSFFWCDTLPCARSELVRISYLPTEGRVPLKVESICLPFVFVKLPGGQYQTLDVRLTSLARLEKEYAKTVWKALRPRTRAKAGIAG